MYFLLVAPVIRAQAMVPPAASAAYRRRILLDIGAREFESSIAWFLHAYPGPAFDDIYAFEMQPHTFEVPAAPALRRRFGERARPFETGRFHFQVWSMHAMILQQLQYISRTQRCILQDSLQSFQTIVIVCVVVIL